MVLAAPHRQRPDPPQHTAEQPPIQMALRQEQPVIARVLDQEHARISVETRDSPVGLVYAALGLEGEAAAPRFSSAASSFGKSLYPFTRRKFFSATNKAEPTQRSM